MERLDALWQAERPAAPLWAPVFLGLGVQLYFWAPAEPNGWALSIAAAAPILIWTVFWPRLRHFWLLGFVLALISIGFALTGARARLVAAPVLTEQLDATVEGVIVDVERTRTGRPRLVMDDLVVFGLGERETPEKVQISLLRDRDAEGMAPGVRVSVFAHIGPPGGPVEPGGFDFRRTAWFEGLGGVGYARGAPVAIGDAGTPALPRRVALWLAGRRADISAGLRERLEGETGAFAAAVTVGDRAAVSTESLDALRASNLAHLLAISGLHMGLVTALVFGAARLLLALTPGVSRRWRTKRLAAVIALVAALGYLALSGASIATQRAFIMAAVALVAIILNRPAITMRALAVAALIILIWRPESLMHVGFQMSFAATAAIIAGFDYVRARGWTLRFQESGWKGRIAGYVLALAMTSFLAGAATAPFGAFHFNQISQYGLIANLAAVPVMGFWVAPSGLAAALLAPLGLEAAPLWLMGRGIETILAVARFVASLDGATRPVAAGASLVLTLIALGGLGLCLGRGLLRPLGAALILAGVAHWATVDTRPLVLVAPEARLIGVLGPTGRRLDHATSASYAARVWLQRDGDPADQKAAARRGGFTPGYKGSEAVLPNGWRVMNVLDRRPAPDRLEKICRQEVVVLAPYARARPAGECRFMGRWRLLRNGALSIEPDGDAVRIRTAARQAGDRFWTGRALAAETATAGLK